MDFSDGKLFVVENYLEAVGVMTAFKNVRQVKSSLAVTNPPHCRAGANLRLVLDG